MSIASRITEMEQHIGNAYDKIEDLGIDLTDVDKNINNISSMLEEVWEEYPKVTATDVEEASINGTKKGRMEIDLKGQTSQDTYTGKNKLAYTLQTLKTKNTLGTWNDNVYTYNGVTYTVNDDLTVLVNGTSQTSSYFVLTTLDSNMLNVGTEYILNGCPTGGDVQKYSLRMYDGSSYVTQSGNDLTFTYGTQGNVRINVFGGSTATNQLFKPMIRLSSVADNSYEPYCRTEYQVQIHNFHNKLKM